MQVNACYLYIVLQNFLCQNIKMGFPKIFIFPSWYVWWGICFWCAFSVAKHFWQIQGTPFIFGIHLPLSKHFHLIALD